MPFTLESGFAAIGAIGTAYSIWTHIQVRAERKAGREAMLQQKAFILDTLDKRYGTVESIDERFARLAASISSLHETVTSLPCRTGLPCVLHQSHESLATLLKDLKL